MLKRDDITGGTSTGERTGNVSKDVQHVEFSIPSSYDLDAEDKDYIEVGYEDGNNNEDRNGLYEDENDSHTHPSSHPGFGFPSLRADGSLALTSNPVLNGMLAESYNDVIKMYTKEDEISETVFGNELEDSEFEGSDRFNSFGYGNNIVTDDGVQGAREGHERNKGGMVEKEDRRVKARARYRYVCMYA
jgi:hypothetical protein